MATNIKKLQNKELKKYGANRVRSIQKSLKPRIASAGSVAPAKRTLITVKTDIKNSDVRPIKPVKLKKKKVKKKK